MDDEKLIECVRKYEFLYNLKHPKYMDTQKKDIAWKKISSQLKHPAPICKQRWQCLRDSYRRALNKKKLKSPEAAKNCKLWRYENEMAFVVPYFMERKNHDIKIPSDDDEFDNGDQNYAIDNLDNPKTEIGIDETVATDVDVSVYNSAGISDNVVQTYHNKPQQSKTNKKGKAIKRKAFDSEQSTSATLMTNLLDDRVNLEPSRGSDELDRFFLNISDTVKKFPPYHQALAKNRIFTLVSEMELELLAPSSSTVYAYSPSMQLESSSTGPSGTPMLTSDNCDDQSENFPHNFTEIKIERQST